MKKSILALLILNFTLFSCIEPEPIKSSSKKSGDRDSSEASAVDSSGIAAKNFAQINNTFSSLTGISAGDVAGEYALIQMQLPSSSNPEALNGFNQIASTRLAFAYCDPYIDGRSDLVAMSNDAAIDNLVDGFIDVSRSNPDHQVLYNNLSAIMNDEDSLINDGNANSKKTKLLKLSCTAILASSYVTLI